MQDQQNWRVEQLATFDLTQLKQDWLDLQSRANHRFFMSWFWFSAWFEVIRPQGHLIRVWRNEQVMALAFVCRKETKRHKLLPVKQLLINETGLPEFDQQWIEYNDILADRDFAQEARGQAISALQNVGDWDELLFGVASEDEVVNLHLLSGLKVHVRWTTIGHGVDLKKIRDGEKSYLSSLSRNARYQIRRGIKEYEKSGSVEIEHASSLPEALEFLEALAPLHIERWGAGKQQSGFANPNFFEFHRQLIRNAWQERAVDLVRISVNGEAFAYFYNFLYQGRVYFYLSALKYSENALKKPGMVGHALCIEEYMNKGFDYYDFMGGGESYKDRLASRSGNMFRVSFQKKKIKLQTEDLLRNLKHKLTSTQQ